MCPWLGRISLTIFRHLRSFWRVTTIGPGFRRAAFACGLGLVVLVSPIRALEFEGASDDEMSTARNNASSCKSQIELWQSHLRTLNNTLIPGLERHLGQSGLSADARQRGQQRLQTALTLKRSLEGKIAALAITCERLSRQEEFERRREEQERQQRQRQERANQIAAESARRQQDINDRQERLRQLAAERQQAEVDKRAERNKAIGQAILDFGKFAEEAIRRGQEEREAQRELEELREAEREAREERARLAQEAQAEAERQQQLQGTYLQQQAQQAAERARQLQAARDQLETQRRQQEANAKLEAIRAARQAEEERLANLPAQPLLDEPLSGFVAEQQANPGADGLAEAFAVVGQVLAETADQLAQALLADVLDNGVPDPERIAGNAADSAADGFTRGLLRDVLGSAADSAPPDTATQYRSLEVIDDLNEMNSAFRERDFGALPGLYQRLRRTWDDFVNGALRPIEEFNP